MDKKHKILIVEDDPFLSSLASEHLTKEGYEVSVALGGAAALEHLKKDIPDLMLLDIIMPEVGGFEVLKIVKADPKYKDIIVIVFSNLGQKQEIEEGKRLGATDFLVKSNFTLKEVVEKIKTLLKEKGEV